MVRPPDRWRYAALEMSGAGLSLNAALLRPRGHYMSMLELRPAVAADVEQMAAVHIAASHQAYARLMPEQALHAVTLAERTRRWAESLVMLGPDEAIIVGVSNARVLGLGHCGLQRTPTLPFSGEFFCAYVAPEAQRHGVGTALMIAMARFLLGHRIGAASLWVARDNVPARQFYDRLGGVVWAERQLPRPDFVLAEVAYAWRDLSIISEL